MIISNGIKFSIDDAIRYGLQVDSVDLETINEAMTDNEQLELLEEEIAELKDKCCDISLEIDRINDLVEQLEGSEEIHKELLRISNELDYI